MTARKFYGHEVVRLESGGFKHVPCEFELPTPSTETEEQELASFEEWWKAQGQFCRAGGGDYEKTFAYRAYQAGRASTGEPK
jgi:hypothetical protein